MVETQLDEEQFQVNQFQENQLQENQLQENQLQQEQLHVKQHQEKQPQEKQPQEKQPQEKQPQENSSSEKTHAQILKENVLKEALSKGKQVIEKNGNGPRKVVFETSLRRAVELVEILRIEEGYVRSHVFKKNKPKTKKSVQTTDCNSSESPCNPDTKNEEPAPKRRKGNSPGSAIYECHCHLPCQEEVRVKNQAKGKTYERIRDTIGSGCRAKITIRYEEGYFQEVKGEINVARFGDSKVTVTWVYDHNHKVILLREFARISTRLSESQPQVRT